MVLVSVFANEGIEIIAKNILIIIPNIKILFVFVELQTNLTKSTIFAPYYGKQE